MAQHLRRRRASLGAMSLGVIVAAFVVGCEAPRPQEWWFQHRLLPGTEFEYEVKVVREMRVKGEAKRDEFKAQLCAEAGLSADGAGSILRIVRVKNANPPGDWNLGNLTDENMALLLRRDSLWYRNVCILRGPLRAGDRVSFVGTFASFGQPQTVVATHMQVTNASPDGAHIAGDFWMDTADSPAQAGKAEWWVESDRLALKHVRFHMEIPRDANSEIFDLELRRTSLRFPIVQARDDFLAMR